MTIIRVQRKPATPAAGPVIVQSGLNQVTWTITPVDGASEHIVKRAGVEVYRGTALTGIDTGASYQLSPPNVYPYTFLGVSVGGFQGDPSPSTSITMADIVAPTAPVITLRVIGPNSIGVNIATASTDQGSGLAGYVIRYKRTVDSVLIRVPSSGSIPPASFEYPLTNLSASTQHDVYVYGVDGVGQESAPSALQQATTQAAGGGGATYAHGDQVVINSSNLFGTKNSAGFTVVDTGAGATDTAPTLFTGISQGNSNPYANMRYRDPGFTNTLTGSVVNGPHPYVTRILGAGHGGGVLQVGLGKTFTYPGSDYYLYSRHYWKLDPAALFQQGNPSDDNLKCFDLSNEAGIYGAYHFYLDTKSGTRVINSQSFEVGLGSKGANDYWALKFAKEGPTPSGPFWPLQFPDGLGRGNSGISPWFGNNSGANPADPNSPWVCMEFEFIGSTTGAGRVFVWVNGKCCVDYQGITEGTPVPGTTRSFWIGGYWRNQVLTANWQYFADNRLLIFDRARVMLSESATPPSTAVASPGSFHRIEPQTDTVWTPNTITFNVHKGRLPAGVPLYPQVRTNAGAWVTMSPITLT